MEEEKQFHQPEQEDLDKGAKSDWDDQTQMLKTSSAKVFPADMHKKREKPMKGALILPLRKFCFPEKGI